MNNAFVFSTLLALTGLAVASQGPDFQMLRTRMESDNMVAIRSTTDFCMILPRSEHTDIGDSEHPGGMKTYCSQSTESSGSLPAGFWKHVELKSGVGRHGSKYKQLTGCIRPELVPALNPSDGGGQYDSNGGSRGQGNPAGSKCLGYGFYVELVEPAANRACLRCCENAADCPTNKDTQGCPNVIPGNYFDCN